MRHMPPRTATDPSQRANNARFAIAALSIAVLTLCALLPALAQPRGPRGGPDPGDGPNPRHGSGWEQGGRGGPRGPMMPWGGPQPRGEWEAETTPLTALVLHHQQGIALANLAATKSARSDLKKFAQKLIAAQTGQLAQLKALQASDHTSTSPESMDRPDDSMMRGRAFGGRGGPDWGRDEEERSDNGWHPREFGGAGPRGMKPMTQGLDRVAQLISATDFDRNFVQTMIGYQAESILAAQAALQTNATPQMTALANQVVSQSAANLAQLSEWNRRWYKEH